MAKKYEFKPDKPYSGFFEKLILTRLQQRNLLKWVLYALVLVALSVVQDVLFSRMRIYGATTELVPCGIFMICLLIGGERGSVFALIASFLYLFSGSAAGNYCVVFITGIAVLISLFRQAYLQRGFATAMLCTGAAMLLYELLVFAIGLFLGLTKVSAIGSFVLTAGFSLLAAPVLYPIVKAIGGGDAWKE